MRLPSRVHRTKAQEEAGANAKAAGCILAGSDNIRLPKGVVAASFALLIGGFVLQPPGLSASDSVRSSGSPDSTLFIVRYEEEGKTTEFAFCLVQHPKPVN